VEEAAGELSDVSGADAARARVAGALDDLADHLLEHLRFEEDSVAETMREMPPR
jgi:hypothetical protein